MFFGLFVLVLAHSESMPFLRCMGAADKLQSSLTQGMTWMTLAKKCSSANPLQYCCPSKHNYLKRRFSSPESGECEDTSDLEDRLFLSHTGAQHEGLSLGNRSWQEEEESLAKEEWDQWLAAPTGVRSLKGEDQRGSEQWELAGVLGWVEEWEWPSEPQWTKWAGKVCQTGQKGVACLAI